MFHFSCLHPGNIRMDPQEKGKRAEHKDPSLGAREQDQLPAPWAHELWLICNQTWHSASQQQLNRMPAAMLLRTSSQDLERDLFFIFRAITSVTWGWWISSTR
mmetsp:Transcript_108862/g.188405  ORF Transcript_108862/g.188405 Transcript_108862/m.188405 type:complete len:103 (+) Transcript_108862:110-418(+)